MRVLHVISGLSVGGAELFLRRLAAELHQAHGIAQHVVSLQSAKPGNIDFSSVPIPVSYLHLGGGGSTFRGVVQLRAALRDFAPDLIQTWMYNANVLGALARPGASSAPLVWNIRCSDPELSFRASLSANMCRLLARVAPRRVICCGRRACEAHVAQGYDRARMIVIDNGFTFDDLPSEKTAENGHGDRTRPIVIGAAGRFDPSKDYGTLLLAFRELVRRGHDVLLRIAGRGCSIDNSWFQQTIGELGLESDVELLGQQSDMASFYGGLDIFCLPSKSEGFPNVLCEAMANAVPAVSTDVADAAEIVGDCGVVVPPRDPILLADALEAMVVMSWSKRTALGMRGARRIREAYDLRTIARQYADHYRTIIAEGTQAS